MATTTETDPGGEQQPKSFAHLIAVADTGTVEELRTAVSALHPADVAELIDLLERSDPRNRVFGVLAPAVAGEVLSLISPLAREKTLQDLSEDQVRRIFRAVMQQQAIALASAQHFETQSHLSPPS